MPEDEEPKRSQEPVSRALIEALIDTARKQVDLGAKESPDSYWYVVRKLHGLGCPELLEACVALMKSNRREDRVVGYDVAAQAFNSYGLLNECIRLKSSESQEDQAAYDVVNQAFEKMCQLQESAMRTMIVANEDENDMPVLTSLLHGLGHIRHSEANPIMIRFAESPHAEVRYAVARGLQTSREDDELPDEDAISALIRLSGDADRDVRDWATFGLGKQTEADTPEIRVALKARLNDDDEEVRFEALAGLAKRRDPQALPIVRAQLQVKDVDPMVVEAAKECADKSLLPLLEKLIPGENKYLRDVLDSAIRACRGDVP